MLMVIAKVKTGQQRQPKRKVIGARIMVVWELALVAMRQICAKVKELHRGQYCRDSPHDDCIDIRRAEQDIADGKAKQNGDLSPPEILQKELHIPRPKGVRVSRVEIWIICCARIIVVSVMSCSHVAPIKTRIDKHDGCADGRICFLLFKQASMHGVMGNNKHPRIKPALQRDEAKCLPKRSR